MATTVRTRPAAGGWRARAAAAGAVVALAAVAGVHPGAGAATDEQLEAGARAAPAAAHCPRVESNDAPIDRVAGADRFATAACASIATYPDGAPEVLLARGDPAGGLADALAGAVLAHAAGGPVLLTMPDQLPASTRAELQRLAPERITILGGPAAVSEAVERAAADLAPRTRRVAGPGREATAAEVARAAGAAGTAFVVNGHRPADSLVAAAPAARQGAALLLTGRTGLPAATADAVGQMRSAVIVGGYGVVSTAVEDELREMLGADAVRRVAGADRAATAASVARAYPSQGPRLLAAQADAHLVDAATAGWAAARTGGPVLYAAAARLPGATDRYLRLGGLDAADGAAERSRLVGGAGVLPAGLVDLLEQRYAEAAAGGPPPELRGVWVHLFDRALKSREGITAVVDAAARANLNTVIVQVARRQDAYYRSAVLPRTVDPEVADDLDVLAELVPAAHDRGLQVHAWVSTLPAYHPTYDDLDLDPDHVWVRHGPSSADPWTTRAHDGTASTFLDPGVPAVQEHVAAVAAELAARSAVDAVHVDYLRYEGAAWGYHPVSLARYREHTRTPGTPAPADPAWQEWRRRQTTDLARRIFLEVRAADPTTAVSLAASTMGAGPASSGGYVNTRTFRDVFQDWPAWLAEGVVDAVFPMNYFREHDATQRQWFDDWVGFESGLRGAGRVVAVGQAGYLNTVEGSLAQLARARDATDGVVLYSYQQSTAQGGASALRDALPASLFADPAPAPALSPVAAGRHAASGGARSREGSSSPGTSAPAAGHLLVRAADGVEVSVRAEVAGGAQAVRADATGRAGFPHLSAGRFTVSADGFAPAAARVRPGAVTRVALQPAD